MTCLEASRTYYTYIYNRPVLALPMRPVTATVKCKDFWKKPSEMSKRLELFGVCFCFFAPFTFNWIPFLGGYYGLSSHWCWSWIKITLVGGWEGRDRGWEGGGRVGGGRERREGGRREGGGGGRSEEERKRPYYDKDDHKILHPCRYLSRNPRVLQAFSQDPPGLRCT